jgi:predicted restriction endonuclease
MKRRTLTEEEAKRLAEKVMTISGRTTFEGYGNLYMVGFASVISEYLGHKSYGLYSETAHKLAEKFIKKWEHEGKLQKYRSYWRPTEKWK